MAARKPARTSGTLVVPTPYSQTLHEQQLQQRDDTIEILEESLLDLERSMMDPGWIRMTALADRQFSPEGMRQIRRACRIFNIISPLIKRGLNLKSAYVWGAGVEITARANGRETGEQDVQAVVNDFLTDPGNVRAVTGPEARDQLEHALGTDGDVFVSCFTLPVTGQVSIRVIPRDEIVQVISNPDDQSEPWFYHRRWFKNVFNVSTGTVMPTEQECYYPAMNYRPTGAAKPRVINSWPVRWDAPIKHVAVNRPLHWDFGVPDAYAAIDWARAYKDFLEDWAKLVKSLSRFAFKATAPGSKAAQVRAAMQAAPGRNRYTEHPDAAGGTAIISPDVALEAMNKSGATIDADSGRPLATMVASALDVPVTMLLSDPGQTGARATAETLDQPTENAMKQRREVWTTFYGDILRYVITESVRAPKGSLKGMVRKDPTSGREYVTLAGDTTDTVDITWPDLTDTSVDVISDAIMKANSTGTMPPEVVLRLILTAFGVRGVDEIVERMTDEDGDFIWPKGAPMPAGSQLALLSKLGADPAQAGTGPMAGDEQPDNTTDDGAQPGDKAPAASGG
jgi:hypothetical protein